MSRARTWTCKACRAKHPRLKQKCPCGGVRPVRRTAAQRALADPYEAWVVLFGERCNICGREPSERRRLDRDHDHRSLEPRGLLCARCNRALPSWIDADWLIRAAAYLSR